jgi:Ca-activated chloride channel family protein
MELTTHLGQDRFAWMSEDDRDPAHLLVEVKAPELPDRAEATPTNLVVVLDRSGSMEGAPLDEAKKALRDVVDQLSPADTFGLVIFDNEVDVVVPVGRVRDKGAIKRAIGHVEARGSTDLGAGLVRGLQEAKRIKSDTGVRVLLISDGHANQGVQDPAKLGGYVGALLERRITTSSLGMGLGYDERLLSVIAQRGGGSEYFAEESDTAGGIIRQECGDLLNQRFLACRLRVTLASGMSTVKVLNEATCHPTPDGIQIELGGLSPTERRKLVLRFDAHEALRPGRRKVAKLRLDYVFADDLSDRHTSTSVWARVVRPGEKPARIDRAVMAEVLFQQVQQAKRRQALAYAIGDVRQAGDFGKRIEDLIKHNWSLIPPELRAEFQDELDEQRAARDRVLEDVAMGANFNAKSMSMQASLASRERGKQR